MHCGIEPSLAHPIGLPHNGITAGLWIALLGRSGECACHSVELLGDLAVVGGGRLAVGGDEPGIHFGAHRDDDVGALRGGLSVGERAEHRNIPGAGHDGGDELLP
jgi:hypothetical protein